MSMKANGQFSRIPMSPIIDRATFDNVQRIHSNGKRIPYYTCAQYGKIPVGGFRKMTVWGGAAPGAPPQVVRTAQKRAHSRKY